MDGKMGNRAVSLGAALFPLFPCPWVSLCNSSRFQEGAILTTLPLGLPGLLLTPGMHEQHPLGNLPCLPSTGLLCEAEAGLLWHRLLLACFLILGAEHAVCVCPRVLSPLCNMSSHHTQACQVPL